MPSSQKVRPAALSSSPTPSQSLDDSGNAGKFTDTRENSSTQRRLTRQRKLRHVSDDDVGLQSNVNGRSHSLTNSPDSAGKLRSPDGQEHWSSSATPKPLPRPESFIHRRPQSSSPAYPISLDEGHSTAIGRWNNDRVTKLLAKSPINFQGDVHIGSVSNGQRLSAPGGLSAHTSGFLSPPVSPPRSNTKDFFHSHDVMDSTISLFNRRRFSHDLNVGRSSNHNLMLVVPTRSAPTSVFSSPVASPRRSDASDVLNSPFWGHQDQLPASIALDVLPAGKSEAYSLPVSPRNLHTPERSPQHSLSVPSSYFNARSPNRFPFPPHANPHPLPLPPGALQPSQQSIPPIGHHITEKPASTSMKGQWQKGKLIGRGTYGSVYYATNRTTGASCAMKEVDIIPDDPKSLECIKQLEQEIKVLQHLEHPNIVQYYGSEIVDDHFYIYLELVHPGSLNKYIREHCGGITESIVRNFTRHILSGLAYLHSKKTIHRDIKGANLLVNASGVVKLADFGTAKHLTGLSYELSLKGSPYWMAPEVIKAVMQHKDANPNLALAVDIWSLGCTVIEMFNGKPPWSEFEGPTAMFKVLNQTPLIPEALSPEGKDFLQRCFKRNPAERPSAATLLDHPFVRNSADQSVSALTQAFSSMNQIDKSHGSPRNCNTHISDLRSTSPITQITNGKLPHYSETRQVCHAETFACAGASCHPRCSSSTLEVPTSLFATKQINDSHIFSLSSHAGKMPLGTVNNHPCALLRTQGKEVQHI
ncbi:hypothetical protein SLA2020_207490 [Shorea laevis]